MWLSELSAALQTERSLVQFLVRARAWVVGSVSGKGRTHSRGNQLKFLSRVKFLPPFPSL